MSICHVAATRKYHAEANTFEINITIQTFKYTQLRETVIGAIETVFRSVKAWRDGWQDGQRMYHQASSQWPYIGL